MHSGLPRACERHKAHVLLGVEYSYRCRRRRQSEADHRRATVAEEEICGVRGREEVEYLCGLWVRWYGGVGRWEHRRKAKAERRRDGARRLYSEGEAGPAHVNSNEGSKEGRSASQPAQ
jgi:hypothetical protein